MEFERGTRTKNRKGKKDKENMCKLDLLQIKEFNAMVSSGFDLSLGAPRLQCRIYTTRSKQPYHIVTYDKSILSNDLIDSVGVFRSVVLNSSNNLVSFSPPKSIPMEVFMSKYVSKTEDIEATEFVEGTMINVFWDPTIGVDGAWEIATRNSVGAEVTFYKMPNSKTFHAMFLEACKAANFDLHVLNKSYCYSFVLQHPENRIVAPLKVSALYLVEVYEISGENFSLSRVPIQTVQLNGFWAHTAIQFPKIYTQWHNYKDLIDEFASLKTPYHVMGVVLKNTKTMERSKFRNPVYEEVRQLRGNQPKLQYQYLTLRKSGKMQEFLRYYPELKKPFAEFREYLHLFTKMLYDSYIECFIRKTTTMSSMNLQFKHHVYKLHERYIHELHPMKLYVTFGTVIDYINGLTPSQQMYSLNYPLRQRTIDAQK